jgi:hypothetical protein
MQQSTVRLTQPKREKAHIKEVHGLPIRRGMTPGKRFVYVHYPKSWEFVDQEWGFLPIPSKVVAVPGCNGVSRNGDLTPAIIGVSQKGGTYIDPTDARLGEYEGYVQYYDCDNGARWYCDFCSEATVLPDGQIIWSSRKEEWLGFKKHLATSGILAPLIPEVYEMLVARQVTRTERIGSKLHQNPHLKAKYDSEIQKLEDMKKCWADMNTAKLKAAKSKPKASRRRSADPLKGD